MLRKYSNSRTFGDNIKLGTLTAFIAGMVNVSSLVLFFSFTSNVTGHYAILAEEISKGKWFQVAVVFCWIFLFFAGSFLSNTIIMNGQKRNTFLFHSIPIILEMICFIVVGVYGHFVYSETLFETEFLVAILLFAMGLQNGLTASISNFVIKTTHLTGLTTDLAIHLSMLTKKKYRENREIREKFTLLLSIAMSYLGGGILAGSIILKFEFLVFFFVAALMSVILVYDLSQLYVTNSIRTKKWRSQRQLIRTDAPLRND
jgi:uncharacterized membrane protein YoaK (UPF0700 family)